MIRHIDYHVAFFIFHPILVRCWQKTNAPSLKDLCKENERKQQIHVIGIFLSPKGHNSFKNCSFVPKIKLDLDISMINVYMYIKFLYVQPLQSKWTVTVGRSTYRQTNSSRAICPPFFEGDNKNALSNFYENKICITENNNGNVNDYFQQLWSHVKPIPDPWGSWFKTNLPVT